MCSQWSVLSCRAESLNGAEEANHSQENGGAWMPFLGILRRAEMRAPMAVLASDWLHVSGHAVTFSFSSPVILFYINSLLSWLFPVFYGV